MSTCNCGVNKPNIPKPLEKGNYAFSEGYNKVLELSYDNNITEQSIKKQTEMYFQLAFESYLNY